MDTLDPFTAQAQLGSCLSFSELLEQGLKRRYRPSAGRPSDRAAEGLSPPGVEEGADTIVWPATLPVNGPSGGFFHDRKRIDW